jgi:hypothetical protein
MLHTYVLHDHYNIQTKTESVLLRVTDEFKTLLQ